MALKRCLAGSGVPVLPYANHLQCGLQTANQSDIESCCDSDVEVYQTCYMYCKPKANLTEFVTCVSGGNSSDSLRTDAFCQSKLYGDISESIAGLSGSGAPSTKKTSMPALLVVALLAAFLLVAPASATITDRNNNIARRADSSCQITIQNEFNTTAPGLAATTDDRKCETDGAFCSFGADLWAYYFSMNRTLNGQSAAEPKWDNFFEHLGRTTSPKRTFPAQSNVELFYQWVALPGTTTAVGFTQILYCVTGKATNCNSELHQGDDEYDFNACGPTYQSGTGLPGENWTPQGVYGVITKA